MIELPLAILLWIAVFIATFTSILIVSVALHNGISKYIEHKQQLKWDEIMKGMRK